MPRVIKNKSAIQLVENGGGEYSDKQTAKAINEHVIQILNSCNSIIDGFNSHYETLMDHIDYGPIQNLKNSINVLTEKIENTENKDDDILEICNKINQNIDTLDNNDNILAVCNTINQSIGTLVELCNTIVATMAEQQASLINQINNIDTKPTVDLSKIQKSLEEIRRAINKQSMNKQSKVLEVKPVNREWDFDMIRDMDGRLTQVKAKQVTH